MKRRTKWQKESRSRATTAAGRRGSMVEILSALPKRGGLPFTARNILRRSAGSADTRESAMDSPATIRPLSSPKRAERHDTKKLPLHLIPTGPLSDVARVFAFGNSKYKDPYGWRNGLEATRVISAILRHTLALLSGEDIDPESGIHHCAHIGWNSLTLQECLRLHPEIDDRLKDQAKWDPLTHQGGDR